MEELVSDLGGMSFEIIDAEDYRGKWLSEIQGLSLGVR
jgi:hypothetical protein